MSNPDRVTYFGATDSRGKKIPFGIKSKDRNKHMYVIGKSGMGKSTLLENMAIQDIRNGEGLAFIDPHGGTAEKLLEYIPKERIKDVIYFAPFDLDNPIAFNVMEDVGYDKRHLVTSGLMATFKKIWEDAWSARMEYILTNTLLALLEYPGATLLGVNRMYTDKVYRKKVVDNIKDPVVKDFWTKEFAGYTDRFTQEATPAIQNKIGQFTSNPLIRNIIGQSKSSFDMREVMDGKKILIINLSKGLVGEVNMRLLGSMLTTRIFLGAMSRADVVGDDMARLPEFYFYVDEFQNFANETFAEILSEARKYKLNLLIAHQYVEQMEEQVRAAVFGNVGTTLSFRVGPFDAETLETVFSPEFLKEDIVNLGLRQIYLSLMIDGVGSRPFSAVTLPPIEPPPNTYKKEVIESSRLQFGNKRGPIEEAIFAELAEGSSAPPEPPAKSTFKPADSRADTRRPDQRPQPKPEQREETRSERPRSEEPRRQTPERPRSEEPRRQAQDRPRENRPTPAAPPQKSAEDLKAILRTMTASAEQGKKKVETEQKSSLKGALSEVLKTAPESKSPAPQPVPKQPVQPKPTEAPKAPSPFEIPEDTLRAIFKEDV